MTFTQLTQTEKIALFEKVSKMTKLDPSIIEKDWWVTTVLRALFALPYAEHLGTSLSKAWNIV
jgi:hypothetical protein